MPRHRHKSTRFHGIETEQAAPNTRSRDDRLNAQTLIEMASDAKSGARREQLVVKVRRRIAEHLVPGISAPAGERSHLFACDHVEDFAMKVVGIGNVGTRCFVALFLSPSNIRCCCSSRRPAPRCLA